MNPNFLRSVADRNAVRNEYIKNLQLETANNLMNYNSNQIFKQTGQLPPSITAMVDTRSITEKYADQQKAKVAVIAGLREITDGANANEIVSQISGRDMIDLLNNLPAIVADIKPKWSLGITAPAFLSYWKKYQQAMTSNAGVSINPIIQSTQLLTNIEGILQNIQTTMPQPADYQRLKIAINALPKSNITKMTEKIIADAEKQAREIEAQARALTEEKTRDPVLQQQKLQMLNELISNSPNRSAVVDFTNQLEIASRMGASPEELQNIQEQVVQSLQVPPPEEYGLPTLQEEKEAKTPKTPSSARTDTESVASIPQNILQNIKRGRPPAEKKPYPTSFADLTNMTISQAKDYIREIIKEPQFDRASIDWGSAKSVSGLTKTNLQETNLPELINDFLSQKQPPTGRGVGSRPRIQGRGVNANRTHAPTTRLTSGGNYRFTPKVDKTKKVEKVPSYLAFGSQLIHQHDLIGGVLKLRHKSGATITDIPTQAIGGQLKKVLLTLTGTGSPSFEDINELSEKDKALLNKVVRKAKIDQRLLVPTPDKTKEEQDYNRLQILSGEINAGNNNPQIVKELKVLLLRLKNGGRIPKRHYHEIMEDLLSIGY